MNFNFQKRFWSKVEVREWDECWEWTAARTGAGYGAFQLQRKQYKAHRISWQLAHPDEMLGDRCVCHSCDNPACANPAHLWAGTHRDNARDKISKGRQGRCGPKQPAAGDQNGSRLYPERLHRGENHGMAKLTDEKVRKIRADTRLQREIAVDYGVTQVLISKIKRRAVWKHVP